MNETFGKHLNLPITQAYGHQLRWRVQTPQVRVLKVPIVGTLKVKPASQMVFQERQDGAI